MTNICKTSRIVKLFQKGGHTADLTAKKIIDGKIRAVIAMDPGKTLEKKLYKNKIGVPAGPLFPNKPTKATVQPTDA